MTFELFGGCDEYEDYELSECGRNAACRSIVLTLRNGKPNYAVVRRSLTNESEFGDKAEFMLGDKAFAALVAIWGGHNHDNI
jgi:hypothetical protein